MRSGNGARWAGIFAAAVSLVVPMLGCEGAHGTTDAPSLEQPDGGVQDSADAETTRDASLGDDGDTSSASAVETQDAEADGMAASTAARCIGRTGAAGDSVVSLVSGFVPRTSLLHVPASYNASKTTMLVLNFHGFSMTDDDEAAVTGMNASSDAHGFIVAYPQGIADSWNAGSCCGTSWVNAVDDVQFTRDLITQLTSDYCVDPKQIFVAGFSNGGFMAHRLACEASDEIAAIAPVSGVLGIDASACTPARAVPVYDTHGTADPVVPYDGGVPLSPINFGGPIVFQSVDETITTWRTKDGCTGAGQVTYVNGDAECVTWGACANGADVTLCTITGGGHAWPDGMPLSFAGISGGYVSTDIDTTEAVYQFFVQHPMP